MATYIKYHPFVEYFANKQIDAFGPTDIWKAVIHTDAPIPATDGVLTDLIQIAGVNGYTTGGLDIGFSSTRTGNVIIATANDVIWTAIGGNLGSSTTGQFFSIYNFTTSTKVLLCGFNYGVPFTVALGETMALDFGTSLWQLS